MVEFSDELVILV